MAAKNSADMGCSNLSVMILSNRFLVSTKTWLSLHSEPISCSQMYHILGGQCGLFWGKNMSWLYVNISLTELFQKAKRKLGCYPNVQRFCLDNVVWSNHRKERSLHDEQNNGKLTTNSLVTLSSPNAYLMTP